MGTNALDRSPQKRPKVVSFLREAMSCPLSMQIFLCLSLVFLLFCFYHYDLCDVAIECSWIMYIQKWERARIRLCSTFISVSCWLQLPLKCIWHGNFILLFARLICDARIKTRQFLQKKSTWSVTHKTCQFHLKMG